MVVCTTVQVCWTEGRDVHVVAAVIRRVEGGLGGGGGGMI